MYLKSINILIDVFFFIFQQYASKKGGQETLLENMNTKYYYYTRTKGLFRICYPKERPPKSKFFFFVISELYCIHFYTYTITKRVIKNTTVSN